MVEHLSEAGVNEIASLIDFGMDVDTVMDGLHWLNVLRKRCQKRERPRKADPAEVVQRDRSGPQTDSLHHVERNQSQQSIPTPPQESQEHAVYAVSPLTGSPRAVQKGNEPLNITQHLDKMTQDQRYGLLQDYLLQQFALVLERDPEEFANITNIRSLGLDSLKVMSIVNNCLRDLHITLDAGQFYELTSLDSLTTYIAEEYQHAHANNWIVSIMEARPSLQRRERQMYFPQSFAQQRMWFQNQLQLDSVAYNVPTVISIKGNLDREALRQSLEEIVRRHEILRTTFDIRQEQPVQIINATATVSLPVVDLNTFDPQKREDEIQKRALWEAQLPFDLLQGPLIRVTLLLLSPTEHRLLLYISSYCCRWLVSWHPHARTANAVPFLRPG